MTHRTIANLLHRTANIPVNNRNDFIFLLDNYLKNTISHFHQVFNLGAPREQRLDVFRAVCVVGRQVLFRIRGRCRETRCQAVRR